MSFGSIVAQGGTMLSCYLDEGNSPKKDLLRNGARCTTGVFSFERAQPV
jgi:hypothetical protein